MRSTAFFRARLGAHAKRGGLESIGGSEPDLSEGGINDRIQGTRSELGRIVKEYLGDDPKLHLLVDQIAESGDLGLRMVRDGDDDALAKTPRAGDGLEAIIKSDGSRPTFLITNGLIDRKSSPLGAWGETLDFSESTGHLHDAIAWVGRIDDPKASNGQGFAGTGFLVGERLILTNRHVLQTLATRDDKGAWQWDHEATIDFGHEFRGRASLGPRKLARVVYAGPQAIAPPIDHAKLDVALIELAPLGQGEASPKPLPIDIAPEWAQAGQRTFVVGYPAHPGAISTVLEQLFSLLYGFKRIAPGVVMTPDAAMKIGTAHDATTLGGNSGSVVLVIGRERLAAGLHYAGVDGSQNWCHVLGSILDTPDPNAKKTLRECLEEHGVEMVDPHTH